MPNQIEVIQGKLYAPVKERGIECFHIVHSSKSIPVMVDSMEVEDKHLQPGMIIEGIVTWKYKNKPYKGCFGVLERGTVKNV